MKLLVTNAKTIKGIYYAKGTVAEFGDTNGGSYHRLYNWPYADEDGEESAAPVYSQTLAPGPVLADLTKKELIQYAYDTGVELPSQVTKREIRAILEQQ